MTPWEVRYARQFHEQLMGLSDATYGHVEDSIDVLAGNPGLARDYDPAYEAARPPASCQFYFVPRTTKVIYLGSLQGLVPHHVGTGHLLSSLPI